jgi:hypothetical protein
MIMYKKTLLAIAAFAAAGLAPTSANAHGHGYGHDYGHGRSHTRVVVSYGQPVYYNSSYYSYQDLGYYDPYYPRYRARPVYYPVQYYQPRYRYYQPRYRYYEPRHYWKHHRHYKRHW